MRRENYFIQPQYRADRAENDILQNIIKDKWVCAKTELNAHSNIEMSLRYEPKSNEFYFIDNHYDTRYDSPTIASTISSAFMLYKLLCLEFYPVYPHILPEDKPYKELWLVGLKHKKSDNILTIGDYKAAVSIGMNFSEPDQLPNDFKRDFLELLNFLISDDVVHPYDYTVAGSVA
jgi:hypothetical protein